MRTLLFLTSLIVLTNMSCTKAQPVTIKTSDTLPAPSEIKNPYYSRTDTATLNVPDSEWKKVLSEDVYKVAREKDTERAFTGKYWNATGIGTYYCAACGNKLFRSEGKFASECGWPSFFETSRPTAVRYESDNSINMERIEVLCGRCGGH
ncbi:MAG: peptide-methionine (R)-S-oxide reductase, partial [Bacteroidota bacterium]|nr:peptide-methionine (R)-S-oxide reductase [Bacteroidota bacterium]